MNRACFPKDKHQNSQKWAKFMNFSFWPFFWFGLPGRLLNFVPQRCHPNIFAQSMWIRGGRAMWGISAVTVLQRNTLRCVTMHYEVTSLVTFQMQTQNRSVIATQFPKLHPCPWCWEKLSQGVSRPGGVPLFSGKVQIVSRTLSGLFLVGAVNRPRKRKRTNRENPRRVPRQIGKIPQKSGKSQKRQKRTKKEGQVQIRKPPSV